MRKKILLIDDDEGIRESVSFYLKENDFEVKEMPNGAMAVPVIDEFRPDLVICDIVMPGIGGVSLLKKVRQLFPDLKVVLMSGLKIKQVEEEARDCGVFAFLNKPFSLEQLDEEIIQKAFHL